MKSELEQFYKTTVITTLKEKGGYKNLFQIPKVECVLIDRTNVPAMGAGETAITVVAAAVGNAIFDATGVRIRQVPFTPERVKRAISEVRG